MFRSTALPQIMGFKEYVNDIAGSFCPFIDPSTRAQAMRNSVYVLSGEEVQVEASIFYFGLLHTEILRETRFVVRPRDASLACENLVFRFGGEDRIDGKALFAWPHWLLKTRYTTVGVLFGKFWLGEEENSRAGLPIPPPPYHLLSVRNGVVKRDPQFFKKAPALLGDLLDSDDDGRDVVGFDNLPVSRPTVDWKQTDMLEAFRALNGSGIYETMKEQAQEELEVRA